MKKILVMLTVIATLIASPLFAEEKFKVSDTFADKAFTDMVYTDGVYYATTSHGNIETSEDGINWHVDYMGGTMLSGITAQNNKIIAIGLEGHIVYKTASGWGKINIGHKIKLNGIGYLNDKFYITSELGGIFVSSDGLKWVEQSIKYLNDLFTIAGKGNTLIIGGQKGIILKSSGDGNWEKIDTSFDDNIRKVKAINNMFWAVGQNGLVINSVDGSTWEKVSIGVDNDLYNLGRSPSTGIMDIVGEEGIILESKDGEKWAILDEATSAPLLAIVYEAGRTLIGGYNVLLTDSATTPTSTPSTWAQAEVTAAINSGLVPEYLQTKYQNNINREEFCELVMVMSEKVIGKSVVATPANPFNDTNNKDVLKAYTLEIVNGISATEFAPYANITREQIATMFYRSVRAAKPNFSLDIIGTVKFADDSKIASWAKEPILFNKKHKIIEGVGNNKFAPQDNATREQAIMLVYRTYQKFK